jgi:hypothetical protein
MSQESGFLPYIPEATGAVDIMSCSFKSSVSTPPIDIVIPAGGIIQGLYVATLELPPTTLTQELAMTKATLIDSIITMNEECKVAHELKIQYKITKSDERNFSNTRNVVFALINDNGFVGGANPMFNQNQPSTGFHVTANMKGLIRHTAGERVRLVVYVLQDNRNLDAGDSKIKIFDIFWQMFFSKV